MLTYSGDIWTDAIVEDVITLGAMSYIMDVKVQDCLGMPQTTAYRHFKRMSKEKNYDTGYGKEKMWLIKKVGKGDDKYVTVNPKIAENGMLDRYDLQEYYEIVNEKGCYAASAGAKRKSKKLSIAVALFHGIGIKTFPRQKYLPTINRNQNKRSDILFYTSREVRLIVERVFEEEKDNKIQYGQYDGFLMTEDQNYVVYVVDKKLARLNTGSESKIRNLGSGRFCKILKSPSTDFSCSIYILRDWKLFGDMLRRNAPGCEGKRYKKYNMNGLYDKEYCVPLEKADEIVPLITMKNHREKFRRKFFPESKKIWIFNPLKEFDGALNKNEVLLIVLDCELKHIEEGMDAVRSTDNIRCTILCFDWQEEYLLKAYGTERLTYQAVSYNEFKKVGLIAD